MILDPSDFDSESNQVPKKTSGGVLDRPKMGPAHMLAEIYVETSTTVERSVSFPTTNTYLLEDP